MKKIVVILLLVLSAGSAFCDTYVNGYTRRDGTYVNGYYRSNSNHTKLDNYSTKGNYNPYTGQKGYVDPYAKRNVYYNNSYSNRYYKF